MNTIIKSVLLVTMCSMAYAETNTRELSFEKFVVPEGYACRLINPVKKKHKHKKKVVVAPVTCQPVIKEVVVGCTYPLEMVVKERPKDSISLLGGRTYTGLSLESNLPLGATARTVSRIDAGAMYQRDFDRYRVSIAGTVNGSAYLGLGIDLNLFGN